MPKLKLILAVLLIPLSASAAIDQEHRELTAIVAANVHQGVVNYDGIKADSAKLDTYIRELASVSKADYDGMTRNQKLAYLINAYNAFTLRIVSDFYPIGSIRDIGAKVGGNVFNKKSKQWRVSEYEANGKKVTFRAMGKPVTLDELEHERLRPDFGDPRVHFALVCAAISCPYLRSEAYTAAKLDDQLDDQGRKFLADPFRNRYDSATNQLHLSQIFDWFAKDFLKKTPTIKDFVKKYLPSGIAAQINGNTKVDYLEYKWELNNTAGVVK